MDGSIAETDPDDVHCAHQPSNNTPTENTKLSYSKETSFEHLHDNYVTKQNFLK